MSRRTQRIEDLIRNELSDILNREIQDPRVGLTSISNVSVSGDLGHAEISISVLDPNADREGVIAAIVRARGFIRHRLASRLRHMRATPELRFTLDRGAEFSERIHDLLESEGVVEHSESNDEGAEDRSAPAGASPAAQEQETEE